MAVAASGPNTEILQFDWFTSGHIFSVFPYSRGGNLRKPCLCGIKIKFFHNISSENVLRTIRKESNYVE